MGRRLSWLCVPLRSGMAESKGARTAVAGAAAADLRQLRMEGVGGKAEFAEPARVGLGATQAKKVYRNITNVIEIAFKVFF